MNLVGTDRFSNGTNKYLREKLLFIDFINYLILQIERKINKNGENTKNKNYKKKFFIK